MPLTQSNDHHASTLRELKKHVKTARAKINKSLDSLFECNEVDGRVRLMLIVPKLLNAKAAIDDTVKLLDEINPSNQKGISP